MSEALRQRVSDLYAAYKLGKLDYVGNFIDERVDFISYAPVEVFPCLGKKHGKTEVMTSMKFVHDNFIYLDYHPIFVVVQDDAAAVIIMARAQQRATGRIIQLFLAQFLQFQNGRIVEFREFMDLFDAVEQVLGRHIDLHRS